MALSQKHSGKILVPWFNSHEWKYVYSLIYSEGSTKYDKQKAVDMLQMWKVRMPTLFAGLEGTLIILNAMLYDEDTYSQEDLSTFYGLAIMRFLNLCAANSDQQGTFFRIAKERNLPEWLVNLRHDLAHSQKHSSVFMRKKGIEYCFQWLKVEYWELQEKEIKDFIISETNCKNFGELKTYCDLVLTMIQKTKLPLHVKDLLAKYKVPKHIDLVKILKQISGYQKFNKVCAQKIPELVIENYLFKVSLEDDIGRIPETHLKYWNPLIQCMHDNNVLMEFIMKLNNICDRNNNISYTASLWLKEIFKGFVETTTKNKFTSLKNSKKNNLTLRGTNQKFLDELNIFTNEVIETPHMYLRNYLISLMTLCNYKKDYIELVDNIVFNYFYCDNEKLLHMNNIVKTVDDINNVLKTNIFEKSNIQVFQEVKEEKNSSNKWRKIENTDIYEGCPFGVLPGQSRETNPTIDFGS